MFKEKIEALTGNYNKLVEQRSNLLKQADDEKNTVEKLTEIRSQITGINKELGEKEKALNEVRALAEEAKNNRSSIVTTEVSKIEVAKPETRDVINKYLHKQIRAEQVATETGITSTDATVTIPKTIVYNPESEVKTVVDLSQFADHYTATTASGTYPIVKRATARMNSVAELEQNPALAKPEFTNIDWKVDTYRGAIPLSKESVDDSAIDLVGLVSRNALEQKINTTNYAVSEALKSFTAADVSGEDVDKVKEILNVKLDTAYKNNAIIIASQSFFQWLDTLKDKDGQYLLHAPIVSGSPYTLLGLPIEVVDDEQLGKKGEAHAFIGDVKRGILFVDRLDIQVRWADNEVFGQYLQAVTRFGVKVKDSKAGYFVTVTPSTGAQG